MVTTENCDSETGGVVGVGIAGSEREEREGNVSRVVKYLEMEREVRKALRSSSVPWTMMLTVGVATMVRWNEGE